MTEEERKLLLEVAIALGALIEVPLIEVLGGGGGTVTLNDVRRVYRDKVSDLIMKLAPQTQTLTEHQEPPR